MFTDLELVLLLAVLLVLVGALLTDLVDALLCVLAILLREFVLLAVGFLYVVLVLETVLLLGVFVTSLLVTVLP